MLSVRPFIKAYRWWYITIVVVITGIIYLAVRVNPGSRRVVSIHPAAAPATGWQPPDSNELSRMPGADMIRYGRRLVANTAFYLGPRGTVAHVSNGMNCQNCHLDAGARLYGNNYSAVFSTYPKFRERSGTVENIYKRVNDCLERSLNGKSLDTGSREMQAIYAYIQWLGRDVPKKSKPIGSGIRDLPFPGGPANPFKGRIVYMDKCQRCHGAGGEGLHSTDSAQYIYPPLWGKHSYTTGAGLYRISRFAGYIKDNMPWGASYSAPQLSDEEAWDIAAFVNTQPRPVKLYKEDWPDISAKPIDYPIGPYTDGFSEKQHKYGPFEPIRQKKQWMLARLKNGGH